MRAYGRSHLLESGELERFRHAHTAYYAALADEAAGGLRGPDEAASGRRIDRDLPNLREAHRWVVAYSEGDLAMRLSASLFRCAVWRLRAEVLRCAEEAADLPGAESHALWPYVCGAAGWAAACAASGRAPCGSPIASTS